jgi:hypothetical protein
LGHGIAVVACVLALTACIRVGGRDRSNTGCADKAECEKLVEEAKLRVQGCRKDCGAVQSEYVAAVDALEDLVDRERHAEWAVIRKRAEDRRVAYYEGITEVDCLAEDELNRSYSKIADLLAAQSGDCASAKDCDDLDSLKDEADEYMEKCKEKQEFQAKVVANEQAVAESQRQLAEKEAAGC